MNIKHLEYFVVLAEELHFRRSAERLGITQAPLSLAIQSLELEFGARLFHRTRRTVALSEAGMALLGEARGVLGRIEHARETVWQTVSGEVGRLRVGFTNASSMAPIFSHLIHAYRQKRRAVNIVLRELPSAQQIEDLEERELDVALLRLDDTPVPSSIVAIALLDEPLVLAMHRSHRLAKEKVIHISDLRNEEFISYPRKGGMALHGHISRLCAKRGFEPQVVQEAQQASTLIGLSATGLGIAIVPAALKAISAPDVVFLPLQDSDARTTLYIAHRHSEINSRVTQFIELAMALRDAPAQVAKPKPTRRK